MSGRGSGAHYVDVAGQRIALRFDWSAIDHLVSVWGDDWLERVDAIRKGRNLSDLAEILEAGTGHPRAFWYEQSPPINQMIEDISVALTYAFEGYGLEDDAKKKTSDRSLAVLSRLLLATGLRRADRPQTSGG